MPTGRRRVRRARAPGRGRGSIRQRPRASAPRPSRPRNHAARAAHRRADRRGARRRQRLHVAQDGVHRRRQHHRGAARVRCSPTFRRRARRPTARSKTTSPRPRLSAAVMSFVTGVWARFRRSALMGRRFSGVASSCSARRSACWGCSRRRCCGATDRRGSPAIPDRARHRRGDRDHFGARQTAVRRIRLLLAAAGVAAAVTWFRDARPALIPGPMFGGTLAASRRATLGLGISWSPLMLSTGAMVGMRGRGRHAARRLHRADRCWRPGCFSTGSSPARISVHATSGWSGRRSACCSRAASSPCCSTAARSSERSGSSRSSVVASGRRRPAAQRRATAVPRAPTVGGRWPSSSVPPSLSAVAFGMHPLVTLLALALALVLANVSARATGETDFSPGGAVGTVSLIALANRGTVLRDGGSVAMGVTRRPRRRCGRSGRAATWAPRRAPRSAPRSWACWWAPW